MTPENKVSRIQQLSNELIRLLDSYKQSLLNDEIFEFRKEIRMKIKAIEAEIDALKKHPELFKN